MSVTNSRSWGTFCGEQDPSLRYQTHGGSGRKEIRFFLPLSRIRANFISKGCSLTDASVKLVFRASGIVNEFGSVSTCGVVEFVRVSYSLA